MLSAIATVLLVPPVNLAALALAGVLLRRRRLAAAALAALLLLALPAVALPLLASLQPAPASDAALATVQAVVILGAEAAATEAGAELGPLSLQRLRAGAALARARGLPVLVTGGVVGDTAVPVAVLMAASLATDFGLPPRWVEPASATTWENAANSAALLRRDGVTRVLLVTHPWHMRRALIAFRAAGLVAVPAPLPAERLPALAPSALVPRVANWQRSYFALHEWLGCAWYAARAAGQ